MTPKRKKKSFLLLKAQIPLFYIYAISLNFGKNNPRSYLARVEIKEESNNLYIWKRYFLEIKDREFQKRKLGKLEIEVIFRWINYTVIRSMTSNDKKKMLNIVARMWIKGLFRYRTIYFASYFAKRCLLTWNLSFRENHGFFYDGKNKTKKECH